MSSPTAILLFNLGGPETLEDVEPFLVRLFSDPDIIELPLGQRIQPLFARLLARARGASVRRNYTLIGGGSPQLRITRAQAAALEARLNRADDRFRVFISMRYSTPFVEEALEAIAQAGIRRVVAVPLFPHWSQATTGSWQRCFSAALGSARWKTFGFRVSCIGGYADDPSYLDAFAGTIRRALDGFAPAVRDRVVILFSAHGLPQKLVDRGDPYIRHIEATRRGLLARLNLPNRHLLGYQSRTGPVRWIGPGTDELLQVLGRTGMRELLVVPLSFVSDHIETLYEVDILFAELARRAGIAEYRRVEALNNDPMFIDALANLVEHHLGETRSPSHETRNEMDVSLAT